MTQEEGVRAIIYLQKMTGIVETEAQAIVGWNGMSEGERESTIKVYEMFANKENNQ